MIWWCPLLPAWWTRDTSGGDTKAWGAPRGRINGFYVDVLHKAHSYWYERAQSVLMHISDKKIKDLYTPFPSWPSQLDITDILRSLPYSTCYWSWLRQQCKIRDLIGMTNFFEAVARRRWHDLDFNPRHVPQVQNFVGVLYESIPDNEEILGRLFGDGVPVLEPVRIPQSGRTRDRNHTAEWVMDVKAIIMEEHPGSINVRAQVRPNVSVADEALAPLKLKDRNRKGKRERAAERRRVELAKAHGNIDVKASMTRTRGLLATGIQKPLAIQDSGGLNAT
ncbi:hypothetical protein CALCODRAFT_486512 [Calocera cornea HHB12733]|uniref:Uncharacterized protein n=1 Tax=Calocera cornea HHB12733 TaxID=1353952 RepID=A0A165DNR8_9BASI|nr:hypothetical protein CALCODRAFT_486512 [Calocera cornea HHB12733]